MVGENALAQGLEQSGPTLDDELDLPGSFRYRYQHDIHDADAANQERNGRRIAEQKCNCAGCLFGGSHDGRQIPDRKVIRHPRLKPVPDPQQRGNILLHLIEEYARHNGHADLLREAVDGEVGE